MIHRALENHIVPKSLEGVGTVYKTALGVPQYGWDNSCPQLKTYPCESTLYIPSCLLCQPGSVAKFPCQNTAEGARGLGGCSRSSAGLVGQAGW